MPPLFSVDKMINTTDIILIIKYAAGIAITFGIIMAPAWLARQNGRDKPQMMAVRLASWVFIWSGSAWIWSLFWATRK